MISLDQAREIIAASVIPLPPERVSLETSIGRILAEDIPADSDYPSADRSMMDGYVVRPDATPGTFKLAGVVAAADVPSRSLENGEAMRVFTGAILPPGGGRVLMQEECESDGGTVAIPSFPENLFIRPKGSEAKRGGTVLKKDTRIGATEAAILAQVGRVSPLVIRKPVVRHIATGDEIIPPSQTPAPGKIRDTNTSLLAGLMARSASPSIPPGSPTIPKRSAERSTILSISSSSPAEQASEITTMELPYYARPASPSTSTR